MQKNFNENFLRPFRFFKKSIFYYGYKKYLKKDYDMIIVTEYSTITAVMMILFMRRKNIRFSLNADGGFIKK